MAIDVQKSLRMILEGSLILEADDDKYDLPEEQPNGDDGQPSSDATETDPSDPDPNDPANDDQTDVSDSTDEEGEADPTDDDASTSDDLGGGDDEGGGMEDDDTMSDEDKQLPGELLPLNATSRAILSYRALRQYRSLKDSVANMISGISAIPTLSDEAREVIDICNSSSTKLSEKLTDYILYRYNANSYEVNYQNYMQFVLEKRTIEEMLNQISKITDGK